MVDAAVSNTVDESHEGSSPSPGTNFPIEKNSAGFLQTCTIFVVAKFI